MEGRRLRDSHWYTTVFRPRRCAPRARIASDATCAAGESAADRNRKEYGNGHRWSDRKPRKGFLVVPPHEYGRHTPCCTTNRSRKRGARQQLNLQPTRSRRIPQRSLMHVKFARELIQRQQFRVLGTLLDRDPQPVENACRSFGRNPLSHIRKVFTGTYNKSAHCCCDSATSRRTWRMSITR